MKNKHFVSNTAVKESVKKELSTRGIPFKLLENGKIEVERKDLNNANAVCNSKNVSFVACSCIVP